VGVLAWVLFGLLAGAIAKFIMPGKDPGGCIGTILIGAIGAAIGGFIGSEIFDFGGVTGFNIRSFAIAILGAIILLTAYRLLLQRHPPR
jgi:uncharacterized membrane protein YeaQ/YmgE (transglycosylase-associated protein family)